MTKKLDNIAQQKKLTEHPYFGVRRMFKQLDPYGINISRKAVSS